MPGQLAVGEAALELLQASPRARPPPRLSGSPSSAASSQGGDDVLHRRVAQVGVGGAAQVVVEEAVAADGDRGGGDRAAGGVGEGEPGRSARRGCGRSRRRRRSSARRRGAAHRLLVGGEEAGALRGRGLGPGDERQLVAGARGSADLLAVARPALGRQGRVGDLDDVALGRAGERRRRRAVAEEDARRARSAEKSIAAGSRAESGGDPASRGNAGPRRGDARVAVGRDRVALGAAADLADDQRRQQLAVARLDPQRVGDPLGVEERARAEELLARPPPRRGRRSARRGVGSLTAAGPRRRRGTRRGARPRPRSRRRARRRGAGARASSPRAASRDW